MKNSVPLKLTRSERVDGREEAIILEVQTKNPANVLAIDRAGMPKSVRGQKLRYCLVMRWRGTRAGDPHLMALLSTPVRSGVDCDAVHAELLWK